MTALTAGFIPCIPLPGRKGAGRVGRSSEKGSWVSGLGTSWSVIPTTEVRKPEGSEDVSMLWVQIQRSHFKCRRPWRRSGQVAPLSAVNGSSVRSPPAPRGEPGHWSWGRGWAAEGRGMREAADKKRWQL